MVLQIHASTDVVIFLVGILDQENVYKFPTKNVFNPGIVFRVDRSIFLNEQIICETEKHTGLEGLGLHLDIEQDFSAEVFLPNGQLATLYVGVVRDFKRKSDRSWLALPEILRRMPKNKNRSAYLKAWQVLMGGLTQEVRALEQHLEDQPNPTKES